MFRLLLLGGRMPAYNSSFVFAVFFILYILINTYIFMSVFLAVVYNNYKKYLKVRRGLEDSASIMSLQQLPEEKHLSPRPVASI